MLKIKPEHGVILVGSTSEIGLSIIKELCPVPGTPLILLGRQPNSVELFNFWPGKVSFYDCNLKDALQVRQALSEVNKNFHLDFAIVASAHLPQEFNDDDFESVLETFNVNSTGVAIVLSGLAKIMCSKGGTIVYISSVACIRPRIKNFTYGASKAGSDFFAIGLSNKYMHTKLDIRVVRPGFVHTKLSRNFPIPPFSTTPKEVAKNIMRALSTSKVIIYSPPILRIIMGLLKMLPRRMFNSL